MSQKYKRAFNLFLASTLFIQLGVAHADTQNWKPLLDQLPSANDKCAWWNTTSPNNCNPTDNSQPGNNDPWSLGGDDPLWNTNGPDNGNWGGTDPNSPFSSGNWGGGDYSTPKLTFLESQMWKILTANYTDEVVDDMNEHGTWNSDTQDAVADEIIKKYSYYSTAWSIGASAGEALLDYIFMDKWRGTGVVTGPLSTLAGGGLMATALIVESFKVMQMQLTMLLEIMELYGELPSNPMERSNEASLAMTTGLVGPGLNLAVNRALKLSTGMVSPPTTIPNFPSLPIGPVAPPVSPETLLGKTGIASAQEAERVAPEIMAKSGFLKAATDKFGASKVGAILLAHSTLFKIAASTAFAALTTYGITNYMGKHYKKAFRKMAKLHEHNVLESFKNNSDAKQAVWLILTKNTFRPDKTDDALTPQDAKLYATIVSQKIPLLHYGNYNESDSLFREYKKEVPSPSPIPKPKLPLDPDPFNLVNSPFPLPKDTPKPPNEIDKKLERLKRDLDLQQKLYFVKLVESGMLMKGFLSSRDNDTLETISIELGINPPPKVTLKDGDPRTLVQVRYKALRDGLVGEVRNRVLATAKSQGMTAAQAAVFQKNLPAGDLRYRAGELLIEDFYNPEQQLISKWAERSNISGVIDQKDLIQFQAIAPYLEGEKKLSGPIVLPENSTADGSPRAQVVPQH